MHKVIIWPHKTKYNKHTQFITKSQFTLYKRKYETMNFFLHSYMKKYIKNHLVLLYCNMKHDKGTKISP